MKKHETCVYYKQLFVVVPQGQNDGEHKLDITHLLPKYDQTRVFEQPLELRNTRTATPTGSYCVNG